MTYVVELTKVIVVAVEADTREDAARVAAETMNDDPDGTWANAEPTAKVLEER